MRGEERGESASDEEGGLGKGEEDEVELGHSLPSQYALGVYDQLVSVGAEYGVRNAGMFALNSLRMEKGFRHWGHDLDTETSPLEARLGFTVDMKKV